MAEKKDTTSDASTRFVVSLPAELRPVIEQVGRKLSAAVREQAGIDLELSPAQVIASLVKTATADAG